MLQFKAKSRLKTHGVESSQYNNYLQNIEKKRMEIVSISQIIAYKKSLLESDDNPTSNASKKVTGQLLCMTDDRMQTLSGIISNRGQHFRDNPIFNAGPKCSAAMDLQTSPPRGRHGALWLPDFEI